MIRFLNFVQQREGFLRGKAQVGEIGLYELIVARRGAMVFFSALLPVGTNQNPKEHPVRCRCSRLWHVLRFIQKMAAQMVRGSNEDDFRPSSLDAGFIRNIIHCYFCRSSWVGMIEKYRDTLDTWQIGKERS